MRANSCLTFPDNIYRAILILLLKNHVDVMMRNASKLYNNELQGTILRAYNHLHFCI